MSAQDRRADVHAERARAIREEMKFEVGIMHDRINTLVSAEAFLTISFTMSLTYVNDPWSGRFFWIAPLLALIGFLLAVLAWPGVSRSFEILAEWNVLLIDTMTEARTEPHFAWRPSIGTLGAAREQDGHRRAMVFSRFVPAVFALAWVCLGAMVLTAPFRHP
jgi:hypothetical protein